jgi:hypothetical protein
MFKKIGIIITALLMVSSTAFAGTEDDPPVKEKPKKTKVVCKNVAPKPQPGPNTIQNFVVKRVCKEVPVED